MECFSMRMIFDPFYGDVLLLLLQVRVTVLVLWNQVRAPWSTNTGLSVPVWSSSTCFGVNTQRSVDSCPHTRLPVVVGSVTLSCFSWLGVSRSNLVRSSISSFSPHTGLTVLDNWVLGFGSIRWVSLLLPAISESKSHIQFIFVGNFRWWFEETHVPSGL